MKREDTELVKLAIDAVLASAKLAEAAGNAQVIGAKGNLRDIVTQTDLDISALLTQRLETSGLPVVSEEDDAKAIAAGAEAWLVDPIDGTVNFAHGIPNWTISAGLLAGDIFKLGVVCAPRLDEFYFTLNSERALLNGRPFMRTPRPLREALVAASFAPKAGRNQYDLLQQVNESTRGVLRTGSTSLNICWAATGKLQAAYGLRAKLWDVAGALAVARAAGCDLALHRYLGTFDIDYCVGEPETVAHVLKLAEDTQTWGRR